MKYLQWIAWGVSLPLQAILLNTLLRGAFRTFPFLLVYALVLFLWTVANIAAREAGRLPQSWQETYWAGELVLQSLLYVLVLSLVWRSQAANPNRGRTMRGLLLVIGLGSTVALLATRAPRLNEWMTEFTKYMAFGSALLNLLLWAVLVGKRHSDRSLLMVSGGYGIQSAGEAVSQSLRALAISSRSLPLLITGNVFALLTHSLCLLVWWSAAARENKRLAAASLTRLSGQE
jgi:hypothetical protein